MKQGYRQNNWQEEEEKNTIPLDQIPLTDIQEKIDYICEEYRSPDITKQRKKVLRERYTSYVNHYHNKIGSKVYPMTLK